jgi:very-short-patch-repair endonuclease
MRKYAKKELFIKLLCKDKYYIGNKKHTIQLYKKYLCLYAKHGKCNATMLFEITTCRNPLFYINRGFTIVEASEIIKKIQSRGINFYDGDDTQIKARVKKREETFLSKTPVELLEINSKKGKGWSVDYIAAKYNICLKDATNIINKRRLQKVHSYKSRLEAIGGYKREWSCRCEEYYKERGIEDYKTILHNKFDTRSISSIMRRLSIDQNAANLVQSDINQKCKNVWDQKTDEERKDITIKRTKHFKKYSKSSHRFFEQLSHNISYKNKLTLLYGELEYFLWDKENSKLYFYDFVIPEIKLIVEYNGVIFHPREHDSWATTVHDSILKDNRKKEIAEKAGFTLIYVWENENLKLAKASICNIINNIYDSQSN